MTTSCDVGVYFRHPALLAKMAATLDHASRGRLDLGLGSGSDAPEYAPFGLPVPSDRVRAAQLDEALQMRKLLMTEDAPSFVGAHDRLDAAPSLPRPVQRPHPPIHVGGVVERAAYVDRVLQRRARPSIDVVPGRRSAGLRRPGRALRR